MAVTRDGSVGKLARTRCGLVALVIQVQKQERFREKSEHLFADIGCVVDANSWTCEPKIRPTRRFMASLSSIVAIVLSSVGATARSDEVRD